MKQRYYPIPPLLRMSLQIIVLCVVSLASLLLPQQRAVVKAEDDQITIRLVIERVNGFYNTENWPDTGHADYYAGGIAIAGHHFANTDPIWDQDHIAPFWQWVQIVDLGTLTPSGSGGHSSSIGFTIWDDDWTNHTPINIFNSGGRGLEAFFHFDDSGCVVTSLSNGDLAVTPSHGGFAVDTWHDGLCRLDLISQGNAGDRAAVTYSIQLSRVPFSPSWCTHTNATLYQGDFNGDGNEDLLCRDPGRLWIDYADNSGFLTGTTDWFLDTRWCTHTGATVQTGDFNGDGRTDLLCLDRRSFWIDYADANGQFAGEDWFRETTWCTHTGATVQMGDFNGDGRTDLLCRDPGRLWIDYADVNGQFAREDWFRDTRWCTHTGATVQMGDFNGDGRTDLLCRDPGRLWIDYADVNGQFAREDWFRETTWCTHTGASIQLGDFNGDGRTDLLCRDPGRLWIDYADVNGQFAREDWFRETTWCANTGARLRLADMNGDGRTDLLCRDGRTMGIVYANASGRFLFP